MSRIGWFLVLAAAAALASNAAAQTGPWDTAAGGPECFGDGTGTKCPFENPGLKGRGCDNFRRTGGGLLEAEGPVIPRVRSVALVASGMTPSTTAIFLQAPHGVLGGNGIPFGHGLMCLKGSMTMLAVKKGPLGTARFPEQLDPPLDLAGNVQPPGATVHYQVLYRDPHKMTPWDPASSVPAKRGWNTTNAWRINWHL